MRKTRTDKGKKRKTYTKRVNLTLKKVLELVPQNQTKQAIKLLVERL